LYALAAVLCLFTSHALPRRSEKAAYRSLGSGRTKAFELSAAQAPPQRVCAHSQPTAAASGGERGSTLGCRFLQSSLDHSAAADDDVITKGGCCCRKQGAHQAKSGYVPRR